MKKRLKITLKLNTLFSYSLILTVLFFFISDLCENFPIRIMQFLFARPYFHVFFKPVITVLSKKKVDQTAAAEWNISWVLALSSYCWITERCMVCGHAAFLLREDSSNPLGSLQTGLLSVPGDTKLNREVVFSFSAQEENWRCAPVLRLFQREAEKEFSLTYFTLSLFMLPRAEGWNKLQMYVSNHHWCFYLPSFCMLCIFICSFLRQTEEAEVKETCSSHKTELSVQ